MKPIFPMIAVLFSSHMTLAQELPISTTSNEARQLYIQARDAGERIRPKDQQTLLEQALEKDSTFALAYLDLAFYYPSIVEVRGCVEKALRLSVNASPGERMLIQAQQAQLDNDRVKERKLREHLAKMYPNDKRLQNDLGSYYLFAEKNSEESIRPLKQALEIDPDFHPAYNNLGYAYSLLGRYDEAEQVLKKYTELLPDEANPHDTYAEVLMKQGKFTESINEYKKALAIDSTFHFSFIGLGTNYTLISKGSEGRKYLTKLYELTPRMFERYQAIQASAQSYMLEGKFERAAQEMKRVVLLHVQQKDTALIIGSTAIVSELLAEAGIAKQAENRLGEAQRLVRLLRSLEPTSYAAMQALHAELILMLSKSKTREASSLLTKYRNRAEMSGNVVHKNRAHLLAGRIALHENRYDDALKELEQADQRNPQTLFFTGQVYSAKGNKAKASDYFTKAANFNDTSWEFALVRKKAQEALAGLP